MLGRVSSEVGLPFIVVFVSLYAGDRGAFIDLDDGTGFSEESKQDPYLSSYARHIDVAEVGIFDVQKGNFTNSIKPFQAWSSYYPH